MMRSDKQIGKTKITKAPLSVIRRAAAKPTQKKIPKNVILDKTFVFSDAFVEHVVNEIDEITKDFIVVYLDDINEIALYKNKETIEEEIGDDFEDQVDIIESKSLTPKMKITLQNASSADVDDRIKELAGFNIKPSLNKLNDLSSFFEDDLSEDYLKFRGKYVLEYGWMLWLQEQFDNVCSFYDDNMNAMFYYNHPKRELYVEDDTIKHITACVKDGIRFIIGRLNMLWWTKELKDTTLGKGHANALIFDVENNTLTRFEPHGKLPQAQADDFVNDKIQQWIDVNGVHINGNSSWKYMRPIDYCPRMGPQSRETWTSVREAFDEVFFSNIETFERKKKKESDGFCAAWSLLFMHLRIANPNNSEAEIAQYLSNLSDRELNYKIRKYAQFIVRTVRGPLKKRANDILRTRYELKRKEIPTT